MRELKEKIKYRCPEVLVDHICGRGIVTAILDTGVNMHPDLKGRIIVWKDMVKHREESYDDNGHGTHIAGIIAGSGFCSNGIYAGIAPESKIVSIKVLDFAGNGKIDDVIEGIRFVLEMQEKWNIRIVNISMGTKRHEGREDEEELLDSEQIITELIKLNKEYLEKLNELR